MMGPHDALDRACADVGISAPARYSEGRWTKTNTLSGRNGAGDGRVIVNDDSVTAWNWQTGEKSTVRIGESGTAPRDRTKIALRIKAEKAEKARRADAAAGIAARMMKAARPATHPYLARKGFSIEKALVLAADIVSDIGGSYLVPPGAARGILIPASIGDRISSLQLIWEDGTKKFLAGGEMGGAFHRVCKGRETWLCEGFATALSLRVALRSMNRTDNVVACFSAHNVPAVARAIDGRKWIVTDNDKPIPTLGDIGTGEFYARMAGAPYTMPPKLGDDVNDLHFGSGVFAVQKLLTALIRGGATMA